MAIGLIMSAVGMAANLAGSMMKDKEIVETTKVYTPSQASWQKTGLTNNVVGDIGEQTLTETSYEASNKKKGIMAAGSLFSSMAPLADSIQQQQQLKRQEA